MRAATLILIVGLAAGVAGGGLTHDNFKGKHVLLFVTDQERYTQHFPPGWERANLPGLTRLKRNGLSFTHAYTTSCMCSAARASLWTGYMPAQTSTHFTLEEDMPRNFYPQNPLPKPRNQRGEPRNAIANLAQMAQAAGYETVYKGKFHLTKPGSPSGNYTQADLAAYGYARWNPPDAGADQSLPEGGGNPLPLGEGNNDFRRGAAAEAAATSRRACACVLWAGVGSRRTTGEYEASGYPQSLLSGPIKPPATANETLSNKPLVQRFYRKLVVGNLGPAQTLEQQTAYVNFYANLIKQSDAYLVNLLNTLDAAGLTDKTLIVRTADHGEMGMAHGTLIQKNFNMYEEATRIPLVFSNPKLWPKPKETPALVSHIDFAPTLQSLLGVPRCYKTNGVDYSEVVMRPDTAKPPQDYVLFTYDDYQSGQNTPPYPPGAAFIRGLREKNWKIAMYYSPNGSPKAPTTVEWECYHLKRDQLEVRNLAYPGAKISADERRHLNRLKAKLLAVTVERLGPIPGFQWDLNFTAINLADGGGTVRGAPIGGGDIKVRWSRVVRGRAEGTFSISARTGQIVGTATAKVTVRGSTVKYVGTAQVTGGTNVYRGFTSIPGAPLALRMTSGRDGARGKLRLVGRVTTARVNGKLTLAPLNPRTGL